MNNTNGSEVMKQVEKQELPTAFARVVNVDSTLAYMGSLMTFLAKGSETGVRSCSFLRVRPMHSPALLMLYAR